MDSRAPTLVERYALPPTEIEAVGLRRADAALDGFDHLSADEREIVRRLVWASGDPLLAEHVRVHPEAITSGAEALRAGCAICVDVRMVEVALDRGSADDLGCHLHCAIDRPQVIAEAKAAGLPRAVAAMRTLATEIAGGIVAIGTAPTALLALLDLVDAGAPRPALIIGMPVGFVGAPEAKAELMDRDVPFITIVGTRGGAGLAAATVNLLLRLARSRA